MIISRSKHRSSVDVCADCGASDPSWASINRGLLLCAECCSVHRSMGRHISHVKSLRQGSWPPSLLAMVQALTAQNVNCIWEHSLLDTTAPKHLKKKPQPKDPLHPTKAEFILAKHLRLAYILRARRDEPPSELGRQLHSAVRSSSLDTAMRLLAQGADPNYYNQEKGSTCLHVACRAGQPAQVELLVAWGADPTARDHAGNTASECARQGGHAELGARVVELVYEATDRMIFFLSGEKPDHAAGQHYIAPRPHHTHEMTDVAKAARGKLQLLPNHLFEELVMDIYDEIDRRETEAIWQTSALGLERCGVVFLPVNPALSAPRNQGRQKLARLSASEMATLLRDVLVDATRRQHIATLQPRAPPSAWNAKHASQLSDDEPLYDSVASDDDYAALAPIDLHMNILRHGDTVISTYNPYLPIEHSTSLELRRAPSPNTHLDKNELETLKKELDSRDSTITELKTQLKSLQTIVEQLTKENSVLKTSSSVDDNQSLTSQLSNNDSTSVSMESSCKERGRSLETEHLLHTAEENEVRQAKCTQRPVSMFETREGPKNNWQVTKHQLRVVPSLEQAGTIVAAGAVEAACDAVREAACDAARDAVHEAAVDAATVQRRAEAVTRAIQEVWAAARDRSARLPQRADDARRAAHHLLALFEGPLPLAEAVAGATDALREASDALRDACSTPASLDAVRAAAYELARATKLLVTHYPHAPS